MIVFVTTWSHRYTHAAVARAIPGVRAASYPWLFARRRLPRATYVFTDFDRLDFWQLEVAAHTYRALRDGGCRVLNDPARALQRLALLRGLARDGVNSFMAWPAHDAAAVDRFPVFIRTERAHRGVLTDRLADAAALAGALEALLAAGRPLQDMIIVEYRAEPIHSDVFRKLSFYRVGERLLATPSVHERRWAAKAGEPGAAGDAGYAEDLAAMRAFVHEPVVRRAFETARIEYGRVDAGVVGGRLEIYEINTNPMVLAPRPHGTADRIEAIGLSWAGYREAVAALDTVAAGADVAVKRPPGFGAKWRALKLFPGYQWLP